MPLGFEILFSLVLKFPLVIFPEGKLLCLHGKIKTLNIPSPETTLDEMNLYFLT